MTGTVNNDFEQIQDAAIEAPKVAEGEKLVITSGYLVAIDQFMLSNPQFLGRLGKEDDFERLISAVRAYGGYCDTIATGEYRVHRDPYQTVIVIAPLADSNFDTIIARHDEMSPTGRVFIDTRCVVFVDSSLLFNQELLSQYSELRMQGSDKQARDLLRDHGGAVRYGFATHGDDLGVYQIQNENILALWPDVVD